MALLQYGPATIWPCYNMALLQYGPVTIWPCYNIALLQYGLVTILPGYNIALYCSIVHSAMPIAVHDNYTSQCTIVHSAECSAQYAHSGECTVQCTVQSAIASTSPSWATFASPPPTCGRRLHIPHPLQQVLAGLQEYPGQHWLQQERRRALPLLDL